MIKPHKIDPVQEQIAALAGKIKGLYTVMGVSASAKPMTEDELRVTYEFLRNLASKTSWESAEIYRAIQFCWFLTHTDLMRLEVILKKRLCWLWIFRLLNNMWAFIVLKPHFDEYPMLLLLAKQLQGTIMNLSSTTQSYLMVYAPELKDAVEGFIHAYTPEITPQPLSFFSAQFEPPDTIHP